VTRDPAEGVDADGFLVTGADVAHILPVYRLVLDDCVATLTAAFGSRLDGLYLYGSVATGQADLLALWTSTVDSGEVAAVASTLSARHGALVREVAVAEATPESIRSEADQAFLKHYCVPLSGRDIRPGLPRFRPSRSLADGFNDDLPAVVHRLRSTVDSAPDPAARLAATRKAARRLLLATATVESVSHATWSTDRGTGAALLAQHHPQWTDVAVRALDWSAGRGSAEGVEELLAMGDWLVGHP
jgi:hypothetical protein